MPYHKLYLGLTEEAIQNFSPELMYLMSSLIRLNGAGNICIGIINLFIIFFAFRKREKWAWFSTLINSMISFAALFIITYPIIGSQVLYKLFVVMAVLILIQLFLPFRDFFHKK